MSQDQEWLVRLQFLEEAQEYLNTIESELLGLSSTGVSAEGYNSILRAAHSIKGGSALMGFAEMSQVAHRLEDFFKVLRAGHRSDAVDAALEQLFFKVLDCMGQMSALYRKQQAVTPDWLATHPQPFLDQLYERLGDPQPEDDIADLSAEAGEDMVSMMFSSEVEPCLERIAGILADPAMPLLKEEFVLACQEMAGLGEMLELPAFSGLCNQVVGALETSEGENLVAIAQAALEGLQRAQALVVMGEIALLPTQLDLPSITPSNEPGETPVDPFLTTELPIAIEADSLALDNPSTEQAPTSRPNEDVEAGAGMELELGNNLDFASFQLDPTSLEQMRADLEAKIPEVAGSEAAGSEVTGLEAESLEQLVFEPFHQNPPLSPEQYRAVAQEAAIQAQASGQTDINEGQSSDPDPDAAPTFPSVTDSDATLPSRDAGFENAALEGVEFQGADVQGSDAQIEAIAPPSTGNIASTTDISTDSTYTYNNPTDPSATSTQGSAQEDHPATEAELEDSTVRVSVRQLERLGELFGELNTERGGLGLRLSSLKSLVKLLNNRVQSLNEANEKLRQSYDSNATMRSPSASKSSNQLQRDPSNSSNTSPSEATTNDIAFQDIPTGANASSGSPSNPDQPFDLLEMDQYDDLHLIVQEIIERVVQLQEVSTDIELALGETEGISRELGRTTQQMQIGLTQVRMRPLSDLTRRFPRLLRQLSLHHGKFVRLKERGTSTLIERSILEALQDPLMHLLRNSFDHGIETPETRQAHGKPSEGTIEISASYRGNQTLITISDDGGGIDIDKIKAKVVNTMGLSMEEVNAASQKEILDLIFEPGFSTADAVTDLSGRGVGMDVVRSNLAAIQGSVQVDTEPGQGTTFTLAVPLSLSVTRVLVVECQGLFLAFPTSMVEEMLLLSREQVMTAAERELIEWQGYTVPLLRLEQWLDFNRPPTKRETDNIPIIEEPGALLVSQGSAPYAIHCDRYWGEQEVTTRLVEGNISLPQGFSGCVVLGDGRVVPLVETESLLNWIFEQQQRQSQSQKQSQTSASDSKTPEASNPETTLSLPVQVFEEKPTIMIVDDSINVRRFLAITLEKAGYRVEQAKDGQDAMEKLQEAIPIDAIISDVEMPRMDGFRFLASIRTVDARKHTPVIMLTSRSGDKHRRLAKQLGAADYFSKPFKQNELLKRLEELTQPTDNTNAQAETIHA